MRLVYDSEQKFQLEAVAAVTNLFLGQPNQSESSAITLNDEAGLGISELGFRNTLDISPDTIKENLAAVQRMQLKGEYPAATSDLVFTIEMETGTGKTYVYLRTIFALHEEYGWTKFIIVVPSVAIREGVKKSIDLMGDHFRELYGAVPFDTWIYDSSQASRLRSFATSNTLQILILNIQAFDKKDINVVYQDMDRMSGYRPLEFIQSTNPIVILDEPQNMGSDRRREALAKLKPLFELRYSATHKELVNPIYRLDPVKAYDMGLVKRIEVSSVLEDADYNKPYLKLHKVTFKPYAATIELDIEHKGGPKRKKVAIKKAGVDLFEISGGREQYRDYMVSEIDAENESVRFSNGVVVRKGEEIGSDGDAIMKAQIAETVKRHLDKELALSRRPDDERMKVLSLFFIDRVANYFPEDGKIRQWFVEEYGAQTKHYPDLAMPPVETVHNGYFACSKDKVAKDTTGKTKADDEAYELIMKDKERLLSLDEPLRFIFSHSALREGWDNPNVFQICTLNETASELKKRQEIGRGLRLPVMANGTRCFDASANILTVVANESYDDFARKLQVELQDECGVEFGRRLNNARERRQIKLRKGWKADPEFLALWGRINARTKYCVRFKTEDVLRSAAKAIRSMPPVKMSQIRVKRGALNYTEDGIVSEGRHDRIVDSAPGQVAAAPDALSYLQRATGLTRRTLAEIVVESGRLNDLFTNAQQFMSLATDQILAVLNRLLVEGVEYERIADSSYEQRIFEDGEVQAYIKRLIRAKRSLYEDVEWESETERKFAMALDAREDIKLFIKLPSGFKLETPVGTYNPDWAIVKGDNGDRLYLVRETKSSLKAGTLRPGEEQRIECGRKHFAAIGFSTFEACTNIDDCL
jgi:type III restriction enzyme